MKHEEVKQPTRSTIRAIPSGWACLAMLPFLLMFFPLMLIYEPGYTVGFFLLLLDGSFALVVAGVLVRQALHIDRRERTNFLLLLTFPGFVVAYMLFYGVSVLRFGLAVLQH